MWRLPSASRAFASVLPFDSWNLRLTPNRRSTFPARGSAEAAGEDSRSIWIVHTNPTFRTARGTWIQGQFIPPPPLRVAEFSTRLWSILQQGLPPRGRPTCSEPDSAATRSHSRRLPAESSLWIRTGTSSKSMRNPGSRSQPPAPQ